MRSDLSSTGREVSPPYANGQRAGGDEGPRNVKTGVAIAVGASAILHVSVLVALSFVDSPEPEKKKVVRVTVVDRKALPPPEPEIDPIEVDMFDMGAAPTAQAPDRVSSRSTAPRATTTTSTTTTTGTEPVGGVTTGSEPSGGVEPGNGGYGKLSMRRPQLGMAGIQLHEDPEAHRAEAPLEPSGKLAPDGGGTYRTRRPGFTGRVGRDGKISFKDKPAFKVGFKIPNPMKLAKAAAQGLEDYYRDPWAQVKETERDWTSGLEIKDYTEHLDKRLDDDDKADHGDVATIPILGGSTEITDYVMRKLGNDPYQSDKLLWMDQTRDERVQIGRVHREKQLKRADEIMRRHLDRLWARTDLDLVAKRAALFELWDDGAEDGDAVLVEAANRARALVVGFVRSKLPAGSAGAYTKAELDSLNKRRTSRARFVPYE